MNTAAIVPSTGTGMSAPTSHCESTHETSEDARKGWGLASVDESIRLKGFQEMSKIAPSETARTPGEYLFISYVAEDSDAALSVLDELEARNVLCWIAPRNVRPGHPFDDEIVEAIEGCKGMLLIFSGRCNERDYIRREVTVAGESGKLIIPFRIENAQPKRGLRMRLSDLHWIDASSGEQAQ